MKTCIRGILPEQNTNTFDQPIEFLEAEEEPQSPPKWPEYEAGSLTVLNESHEFKTLEKHIRRCLRWRSDLTSPQQSSFEEFFEYLCRSLNPDPPHELNFANNEKVECAKAALADFNSKHPDTPYTFVEMVSALRISFRRHTIHGNFTARPSDGFGDSSCPRLFFFCVTPPYEDECCDVDCCILLDVDESSRYFSLEEEQEEEEEGVAGNGTVRHPGVFISGGVVHPTDETVEAVSFCHPVRQWSCGGCSHF